jgi:hypothetical protein
MVNKASKKGHIPQRTCVICRKKDAKSKLRRFVLEDDNIVFDIKQSLPNRGYYCCPTSKCLDKLEGWNKKRRKACERKAQMQSISLSGSTSRVHNID